MVKTEKKASLKRRIDGAQSFDELLKIALLVIDHMRQRYGGRCIIEMVCAPLFTGKYPYENNLRRFRSAIRQRRRQGYYIFNQLPFRFALQRLEKQRQGLALTDFFRPLFYAERGIDQLCFLSGWQHSVGARWERNEAQLLRIPIKVLSN